MAIRYLPLTFRRAGVSYSCLEVIMRHLLFILVALTLAMPMALSAGESETESLKKRIAALFAQGGEEDIGSADEIATAVRSSHGVSRVRLTFHPDGGNTRVDEIRILGYVPPGVRHEVGLPRPVSR